MGLFRARRKARPVVSKLVFPLDEHNAELRRHLLGRASDPVLREAMSECMQGHPFADYYDLALYLLMNLDGITFTERHLYFISGAVRIMRENAGDDLSLADLRPMMLKAIECHAADESRWREIWLTIANASSFSAAELTFGYGVPAEYLEAMVGA